MSKVQVDTIDTRSGTSTMQIGSTNTSTINIGVSGDTVNIPSGVTITNSGTANGFGGGITEADTWRITTNYTVNGTLDPVANNWERSDTAGQGKIGTGMSQSSGVFTFPSTGLWFVEWKCVAYGNGGSVDEIWGQIKVTTNNSSYTEIAAGVDSSSTNGAYAFSSCSTIVDVTDTANVKVRFKNYTGANTNFQGSSSQDHTSAVFIRLGDT